MNFVNAMSRPLAVAMALSFVGACDSAEPMSAADEAELAMDDADDAELAGMPEPSPSREDNELIAEAPPHPEKAGLDQHVPMVLADADEQEEVADLQDGQVKVYNYCQSLSLYQYNPAYHGTGGNPSVSVGVYKKLIWQTKSGTPNGWATVLSAGQEYWGWRYARVECLGGAYNQW